MSYGNDHDHRGEYAEGRHDHNGEYAEKHHRHYDLEREDTYLRQLIQGLQEGVRELSGELASAHTSIGKLEEQVKALEETTEAHRENEPHLYADGSTS